MKFDRRTLRPLATFAAGLFALVACQNATEPNPGPEGALLVTGGYSMGNASRIPDSVVWTGPKDNGFQKPSCKQDLSCSDTFRLSGPLGSGSIAVQLWTLGIRTNTIFFGEQGSSLTLFLKDSVIRDSLDILLLSRYANLTPAGRDSISKLGTGASSLVAYYANLLLLGDPAFVGKSRPVGMIPDSVTTALVYLEHGKSIDQLVSLTLSLNLDTSIIRKAVSVLINKKLLSTTDSVALFPPPPVWVKSHLAVADSLVPGGVAVAVKGVFFWNSGHNVIPVIQIRTAKPGDAVNFLFPVEKFLPTDTTWDLNGSLSVQATPQAAPGIDTLVVTLSDGKGNSATSQTLLYVKPAKDTTGPAIHWVSPSTSIGVDATVSSIAVQVAATDPSGVDSVYIQGVAAHNDSSAYWSSTVVLGAANGKPLTLFVKAVDKNRNHSLDSSISITRSVPNGTDKPVLSIQQPASVVNNTLPYDSATLHLVYKITDYLVPVDTSTVKFGTAIPKRLTDSTWAADVPVPATGSPFAILVQVANKNGSGNSETVVVTRAADVTPPTLAITSPSKDTSVAYWTSSITVTTTASDAGSGVNSVTINGVTANASGKMTISLSPGANPVVVIATDKAGNADTAKVTVTVMDIASAPTFSLAGATYTGSQLVSLASSTPGASIYYTVSGSPPTTGSTKYIQGTPISVSISETIKAIAIAPGYTNSPVATAAYTINYDVTLATVSVNSRIKPFSGTTMLWDSLDAFTTTAVVKVSPTDPKAVATVSPVKFADDVATVTITVAIGMVNKTYTLILPTKKTGYVQDSQDPGVDYAVVKIGKRWWTAQNMDVSVADYSHCFNADPANCQEFGSLYMWNAAMGVPFGDTGVEGAQGVCPANWHIPTIAEWLTLINDVKADAIGLRDTSWGGTNAYGFGALPAGMWAGRGSDYGLGTATSFWTSTLDSAGIHKIDFDPTNGVLGDFPTKLVGYYMFSVRCIKN